MHAIPRPEHPRPQFVRESWQNLNGEWEFYRDFSASGRDRKVYEEERFPEKITVPFCPESALSGIGFKDFMPSVWYGKNIDISKEQLTGRVLLHFGACDYQTFVYVNAQEVGNHLGGYASFEFDITDFLHEGNNRIVVCALDDVRTHFQPRGKQSKRYYSHGCDYSRTTGIWQTVWLEFVPETYIRNVLVNATDLGGAVTLEVKLNQYVRNATFKVSVSYKGQPVLDTTDTLSGTVNTVLLRLENPKIWNPGAPELYDVEYSLLCGETVVDSVKSYFGIRRIDIDGTRVLINGKSVFQRLILDQGFYPDGIYTAPSDDALAQDIEMSMALGFNGARLHQKVFEERFLYHADRLGYLVWGEYPDSGLDETDTEALHMMLPEWLECVERDRNHPSIIGWCPHNETHQGKLSTNISVVYDATKAVDSTRPVIDTSGYNHTKATDIYDIHEYQQDAACLRDTIEKYRHENYSPKHLKNNQTYDGKSPFLVSEFGGIKWYPESQKQENDSRTSWGYGDAPQTPEEFLERYAALTDVMLSCDGIMGFCYTQLTDVEQEQNGLYFYDRTKKFSDEIYRAIKQANVKKAAIED